jgi:thiamine pyrophosphokinase
VAGDRTILLFTGGDPVSPSLASRLPGDAFVIAADSGIHQAAVLGRAVDLAVGDFDSCEPAALAAVVAAGAVVERHPEAKEETDLELGLVAAASRCASRVVVVGGHGGRADHFLANALLLASPRFAAMEIVAHIGDALVTVIRDRAELAGEIGELVSLLALGGPADGVRTAGLRYPLRGERLEIGSTRGVSNVFAEPRAVVSLDAGVLLAVQPGLEGGRT